MGIGRKTRIQAKRSRREISKEKYKTELIKTICLIFLVGLTASLLIVQAAVLIYPIVNDYVRDLIKSYRYATVNPFLRNNLKHEDFKSVYLQKEPVLFASLEADAHAEVIWDHFDAVCNLETGHTPDTAEEERLRAYPLTCKEDDQVCPSQDGPIVFNFSSSANTESLKSLISTPRLITQKNETKAIAHFRNDISLELSVPTSLGVNGEGGFGVPLYPSFRQYPQSWNELLVGRKKWYLYRPGSLPSVGFNEHDSLNNWLKHVYPTLGSSSRPIEIIQEEGQVLYIPEGWYHASLPTSATYMGSSPDTTKLDALHSMLTSCGGRSPQPLHGGHNSTSSDAATTLSKPPPSARNPLYALSVQQQASGPEIIRSEYYHFQRGKKFMSQHNYDSAIDSFLQGIALGANVDEVDISSSNPFSPQNDYSLVQALGSAYAARQDVQRAEKCFLFAISLNRLNSYPRMALVELYLQHGMPFMARPVLAEMDSDELSHPDLFVFKYLSNFDKTCVSS